MFHRLCRALILACLAASPALAQPARTAPAQPAGPVPAQPAGPAPAAATGDTIVILDMSASMWGRINDQPKLEIAREAVRGMFSRFPPGSRVGLMAYGHRQAGQCSDIQMLFPPGPVDAVAAGSVLDRLTARGRTPLTEAVRQAAVALRVQERGGTIILVTDGIETCGGDPCALAAELEATNTAFTAHVVGFDLRTPSERARVACIAERTGGLFVPAADADELARALARTSEARPAAPTTAAAPRTTGLRATQGPGGPTLPAATFTVLREGQETPIHEGGALRLPLAPGRYVVTGTTVDRIGTITAEVTATTPDEIVVPLADALPRAMVRPASTSIGATELLSVAWEGPNEPGDYLVIAPIGPNAVEQETRHYAWTRDGTPLPLRAPATAGNYEVHYVLARASRPIGRAPITVTVVTATLTASAEAMAGSPVEVQWTGPRAPGSWIGMVPVGAPVTGHLVGGFTYVENATSPLNMVAPATPGAYEIRFIEGVDNTQLAMRPIRVTAASATLDAPDSAMAGSPVTIRFTPPQATPDSFIAIVKPNAEASGYLLGSWDNGAGAAEVTIHMPPEAGAYEVRYVLAGPGGAEIVARRPMAATAPVATLEAPATAAARAAITIRFTGPRGRSDFVTVVPTNAAPEQYTSYFSVTGDASEGEVTMPETPGTYELRYVMPAASGANAVIVRRPIVVQ